MNTTASSAERWNAAAVLGQALTLLRAGQLAAAEVLCKRILEREPRHPDAFHVLGVAVLTRGDCKAGAEFIHESLRIDPQQPHVLCSLGNALRDLRRPAEALVRYREALRLSPGFAGAAYGEGNALMDLDRTEEALLAYEQARALQPDFTDVHLNRGRALQRLERLDEALTAYRDALALQPNMTAALGGCAEVLLQLNRFEEALAARSRLVALQPGDAEVLVDHGLVLHELRRYREAITDFDGALRLHPQANLARFYRGSAWLHLKQFERALIDFDALVQLEPRLAAAHCNRGHALLDLERHTAALSAFESALQLKPDLLAAADGRGMALRALCRFDEALAAFQQALVIAPRSPELLYRRALTLRDLERHEAAADAFAEVIAVAPDYDYALGNLLHERLLICNWIDYDATVARLGQAVGDARRACPPGAFLSVSDSVALQLQCAHAYVADKHPTPYGPVAVPTYRHERVCVACVSADFRQHPVSQLMAGVLERHDAARFEILALSLAPDDGSALARRVRGAVTQFIDVTTSSDRELAALMRELEVDIAVDLMGLSSRSRPDLFALRPAPVQVNFLGYPGTLGTAYHDYILADRIVIPEAERSGYTEQVVYLPDSFQPNDDHRRIAERTPSRQECGLPDTGFVFCCFNRHYKINPPLFDVWMRLLRDIDGSVLWLSAGPESAQRNLCREAAERGVDPRRLVFAAWLAEPADHLARYRLADLFLDTLPFGAHTTASDALWAGVPLLTCRGGSYAARVSASLLTALGCPELITQDLQEYEALAGEIGRQPALAAALRCRVAQQRRSAPLFDTDRYRQGLEAAYLQMVECHRRGEPPRHFDVSLAHR